MHSADHGSVPRSASLNDLPSSAASSSHGIASGSPPTPYSSQSSGFPSPMGTPTDSFPTTPVEQSPQFSFPEIMSYEDIESDATPYLYQPFIPPYYYSQCQPTYQLASYLAAQLHDLRSQLPSYADSSLSSAADELDWTSFPYH
ncbi:hypothetical protein PHLCEN_2v8425 [Hermanssonia centrifuga]|uniref:Uncharacterized protein n=1 Tax=Hermanssonia centrifuga TaxID=98765 RepID=A0A2R6NTS2_9APHY|nr:hypothetical protein PHLCEN_2v8425 [Hermanssonia centrifuga]